MGSSKGVMDAPRDLRGVSRAHLMLGNSITDVVHKVKVNFGADLRKMGQSWAFKNYDLYNSLKDIDSLP